MLRPLFVTPEEERLRGEVMRIVRSRERLKCILKCSLNLSEEEAHVLSYLVCSGRPQTAKEVSEATGRNPEVVRRALRSLYNKGLLERRPYPLRRGGRAYIYKVPAKVLEAILSICREASRVASELGLPVEGKPCSSNGEGSSSQTLSSVTSMHIH